MINNITAGVIGYNMTEEFFRHSKYSGIEKFQWKKVYSAESLPVNKNKVLPGTEIVSDIHEIVGDQEISLVFLSKNYIELVPGIIKTGKSVRIL